MTFSGKLDRKASFLSFSSSQDSYGQMSGSWAVSFTAFVQVVYLKGKEKFEASQLTDVADIRIRMRWRSDANIEQRIVINSVTYAIYSISEIGRRKGLEIFAKKINNT